MLLKSQIMQEVIMPYGTHNSHLEANCLMGGNSNESDAARLARHETTRLHFNKILFQALILLKCIQSEQDKPEGGNSKRYAQKLTSLLDTTKFHPDIPSNETTTWQYEERAYIVGGKGGYAPTPKNVVIEPGSFLHPDIRNQGYAVSHWASAKSPVVNATAVIKPDLDKMLDRNASENWITVYNTLHFALFSRRAELNTSIDAELMRFRVVDLPVEFFPENLQSTVQQIHDNYKSANHTVQFSNSWANMLSILTSTVISGLFIAAITQKVDPGLYIAIGGAVLGLLIVMVCGPTYSRYGAERETALKGTGEHMQALYNTALVTLTEDVPTSETLSLEWPKDQDTVHPSRLSFLYKGAKAGDTRHARGSFEMDSLDPDRERLLIP